MKERLIRMLLMLCVLVSVVTICASAAEESGSCGESLTWSYDNGTLTISGTGDMYDYAAEGEGANPAPWYDFAADITALVIDEGVTSIGSEAFRETGLGDVDLTETGVTKIGRAAFTLSGLTGIKLPNGLTEIPAELFLNCSNLERVVISDSVTAIGAEAFTLCSSLDSMTIPASVTNIAGAAFRNSANEFYFEGDVPQMVKAEDGALGTFAKCKNCTVYYPEGNDTWNGEVFNANWGSEITWVAYTTEPPVTEPAVTFTDVPDGAWYKEAVDWATSNDITNGMGDGKFEPDRVCTRGQVVTFLWRAAGEPEPATTVNPFTDVKETAYYYQAVLWAVENGITNGMSETEFGPDVACTRGHVVTSLHRTAGLPEYASADHPFVDLDSNAFYYDAVLWAVENDITNGMDNTHFEPGCSCTRGQIVTFLYRYFN